MLALLRGAVGAAAVAALALTPAAVAVGSPAAVTAEPVGGPRLGSSGVVVDLGPRAKPLPSIHADSWLVADLTTGEVLAAKAPHQQVRPASTLKTLTAVTLMPVLPKDRVVTIGPGPTHADGSHVGLVEGATYTVWDLWHGLLLPSGNDAAVALAEANGGMSTTVQQMQAKARELGALDTTVKNSSGLDKDGQYTSAYDMALFARAAMGLEDFRTVTATTHYDFPGKMPATATAPRKTYRIYTQNRLLLHDYPGAVGGKTGFTSLAHRTFWGAAERDGHLLVVTMFDNKELTENAAKALLSWGFANRTRVTPVGTLVAPAAESPSPEPSGGASGDPAAAPGGAAAIAGSTAVSLGSGLRGLLLPAAVVALIAALGWWWWRRRTPEDEPPALRGPVAPDPRTPARAVPVVTVLPEPARPGAPDPGDPQVSDDTAPVPVVAPAPSSAAAPGPAVAPAPPEPPAPPVRPEVGGGNVRVVRPPQRPEA